MGNKGHSLAAVASLVENGLSATRASEAAAPSLQSTSSVVVVEGLSCITACEIFLDQGLNLCLLHWQVDSLPLSHQGSPKEYNNIKKHKNKKTTIMIMNE